MYFVVKPLNHIGIRREFDRFDDAHPMTMVKAMRMVEPQDAAVVDRAHFQIDVSQRVFDNLAIFKPNLLLQERAFALAFEPVFLN
jgi:hypothetical protein